MLTLLEIQARFESALLSLSQSTNPRIIPDEIKLLARSFKQRSRMSTVQIQPDELVMALINVLVIAAELNINLESKTQEFLSQIENPSYSSA
ncbi:MAG: hypothetical protein ACXAC7_00210 [Candidatus Hodarchaeales archaeon]|jgi:hypothetical protein